MAFTNLPANLQDMFNGIYDRLSKLETGPNQPLYVAEEAGVQATQAINEATQALIQAQGSYAIASQALIKDSNTIVNSSNNLTGINGNGITVYAGSGPSSGARVVLNSAGLTGFDSGGSPTFAINAANGNVSMTGALFTGGTISGGSLNIAGNAIITSAGYLTAYGATITGAITATSGSFTGTISSSSGTIGGWSLNASQLYSGSSYMSATTGNAVFNDLTATTITGNTSIYSTGWIESTGYMRANGSLYAAGHTTTGAAANGYVNATTGLIARSTASSQRYKHDIVNLMDVPELDPRVLYELPVRAFRFNKDYLPATDDRADVLVPGFIAEEVDAIYPAATDYNDGQVETWNDRMLVPALLALVQDLNQRLKNLES